MKFSSVLKNSLSIQHGIGWDLPVSYMTQKQYYKKGFGAILKKLQVNFYGFLNSRHANYLVCVDYNFINWYRTVFPYHLPETITVIPNFTQKIASEEEINKKLIRKKCTSILFARRFTSYRGTKIFTEVIKRLLSDTKNIQVGFYNPSTNNDLWCIELLDDDTAGEPCGSLAGDDLCYTNMIKAIYRDQPFELQKDNTVGWNLILEPQEGAVPTGSSKAYLLTVKFYAIEAGSTTCVVSSNPQSYQKELFLTVRK